VSAISIIIPVFNESLAIRRQLPALYRLKQAGHELIIADGGSHDDSLQVAGDVADHIIVTTPPGRARQMAAGIELASHDILLFLHIDTILPEAAAQLITLGLQSSGRLWGRFDVHLDGESRGLPMVAWLMNLRSRLTSVATGDQAIFVSRELLDRVGGMPDMPLMEDIALSKRLRRSGRPLNIKVRAISSGRRWDRHGLWKTIGLMWWLRLMYVLGVSPARLHQRYYGQMRRHECDRARLLLFAKTPRQGQVKTRLQPLLGEEGALRLHQQLIARAWRELGHQTLLPAQLWASEPGQEAFFEGLGAAGFVFYQSGASLGERMAHAAQHTLAHMEAVVIVGSDCPSVDLPYVRQALDCLRQGVPVVLGPAEDGGYVLIGLSAPLASETLTALFSEITWGSGQVMEQTRQRLKSAGISWAELEPRWDVDRPEDLTRLEALLAES
tara:strand:- start:3681 stop:5006 length:1326 start_codon:yes stop_codon:yes gene_type:complete